MQERLIRTAADPAPGDQLGSQPQARSGRGGHKSRRPPARYRFTVAGPRAPLPSASTITLPAGARSQATNRATSSTPASSPAHLRRAEELEPQPQADRVSPHRVRRALDRRQVGKIALGGLHHRAVIPEQRPGLPAADRASAPAEPARPHLPSGQPGPACCLEGKAFKAAGGGASPIRGQRCDSNKACPQQQPTAERRQRQIADEIAALGLCLPGSLVERTTRCGSPRCRCHTRPQPTCTAPTPRGSARSAPGPSPGRSAPPSSSGTVPCSTTPSAFAS